MRKKISSKPQQIGYTEEESWRYPGQPKYVMKILKSGEDNKKLSQTLDWKKLAEFGHMIKREKV